jgi:hypothetical protein
MAGPEDVVQVRGDLLKNLRRDWDWRPLLLWRLLLRRRLGLLGLMLLLLLLLPPRARHPVEGGGLDKIPVTAYEEGLLLLGKGLDVGMQELLLLNAVIGQIYTTQGEPVAPPLKGGGEEAPRAVRGRGWPLKGDGPTGGALPDQNSHPC